MEKTNEDIVTSMLINKEILKRQDAPEVFERGNRHTSNPNYDLTSYLKTRKYEVNKYDSRYLFVK